MTLELLPQTFTVCKVRDLKDIDLFPDYCFVGKTETECSLVCPAEHVPPNTLDREDGWRSLRVEGQLDFSLIGILSGISAILAKAQVGIFVISTFDTDYILLKEVQLSTAVEALEKQGIPVREI